MQKIRKILEAVSEKTALPTNQPTNYYQQHRFYGTWLTPVQKLGKVDDRIPILQLVRFRSKKQKETKI